MKIVIAPDSYKESLSALDVATAIETGFREIYPHAEYVKVPVADGGEGTVEAMVAAKGISYRSALPGRLASRSTPFMASPAICAAPISKWRQPADWKACRPRDVIRY